MQSTELAHSAAHRGLIVKKTAIAIAAAAVLLGTPALAADMPVKAPPLPWVNWILISNNQISLDFAATNIDYLEYAPSFLPNPGSPLDSEKGWVPGVAITSSLMGDYLGIHNLYLYSRSTFLSGSTNYWSAPAFTATNSARVWDEDYRLGRGFEMGSNAMLTPFIGAGWNSWNRDNTLTVGNEHYSNGYVGAGLLYQFSLAPRMVLSVNGLVGSTLTRACMQRVAKRMTHSPSISAIPLSIRRE